MYFTALPQVNHYKPVRFALIIIIIIIMSQEM